MGDNKKSARGKIELVNLWVSTIDSILGISGILGSVAVIVYGDIISNSQEPHILTKILKPIIFLATNYKEIIIPLFVLLLLTEIIIYCLYIYYVKKQNRPPEEAKRIRPPFIITVALLIAELFFVFKFQGHRDANATTITSNITSEYGSDVDNEETYPNKDTFTEKQLVEYYIKRCYEENISIDELNDLTISQLYYIRNGIYAYCGRYYESGYYDEFDWYDGHIKTDNDEIFWELFNSFQKENIEKILSIEKKRKENVKTTKLFKKKYDNDFFFS